MNYYFLFRYSYDVTKCMFSSGNITEKIRIAKLNCNEETVVDLYAGNFQDTHTYYYAHMKTKCSKNILILYMCLQ